MEHVSTYEELAALAWQIELGADEAIGDEPVDRFALEAVIPKPHASVAPTVAEESIDAIQVAREMAAAARSIEELGQALAGFEQCELKKGARNTVVADGNSAARVMIIGEAPGRDEDREGRPFVGRAGQLLDKMLAAISLDRTSYAPEAGVYITNILPWRPPQNRDPKPEEIAMLMPFVERHVALVDPDVIVAMGNIACQGLLGRRGITRMRGNWAQAFDKPVLPMFHPAYLLRNPAAKREAWVDLLSLQARLRGG